MLRNKFMLPWFCGDSSLPDRISAQEFPAPLDDLAMAYEYIREIPLPQDVEPKFVAFLQNCMFHDKTFSVQDLECPVSKSFMGYRYSRYPPFYRTSRKPKLRWGIHFPMSYDLPLLSLSHTDELTLEKMILDGMPNRWMMSATLVKYAATHFFREMFSCLSSECFPFAKSICFEHYEAPKCRLWYTRPYHATLEEEDELIETIRTCSVIRTDLSVFTREQRYAFNQKFMREWFTGENHVPLPPQEFPKPLHNLAMAYEYIREIRLPGEVLPKFETFLDCVMKLFYVEEFRLDDLEDPVSKAFMEYRYRPYQPYYETDIPGVEKYEYEI